VIFYRDSQILSDSIWSRRILVQRGSKSTELDVNVISQDYGMQSNAVSIKYPNIYCYFIGILSKNNAKGIIVVEVSWAPLLISLYLYVFLNFLKTQMTLERIVM